MMALAQRQAAFLAALFDAAPAASPALALYRRNVLAGLHDALAAAFPVVRRLVGEAFFREAAERFARAHPSRSGDLHEFGGAFPGFLRAYPHAAALAYLGDVASLEWALHEAGLARDEALLAPAALAAVPPERAGELRLRLHAAVRLVRSDHPVQAIWEANQPSRDGTLSRPPHAEAVLIARPRDEVQLHGLAPGEWRFAQAVRRGASLAEAADAMGDAASALPALLVRLANAGAFCGFALDPPS